MHFGDVSLARCINWLGRWYDLKLFRPTFATEGVVATPWILIFPADFFREIIYEYVFGVKESNGDS